MSYYDKLNLAINNSLQDANLQYQLRYFNEFVKLAKIIIENTPQFDKESYSSNIPLNDSINNVSSFLYTINQNYSEMFQNILQEKNIYNGKEDYSVRFYKILSDLQHDEYEGQHRSNKSEVLADGRVHIDYSETLEDTFTISHEITHKFSQPKNQNSTIKQFLGETSTISIEFLLQDFLMESNKYSHEEIVVHKNNRLREVYDDAGAVLFENILIDLYRKNNNCITQQILLDYLNTISKDSKIYELLSVNGERYLNEIVNSGSLQFYKRQRYVIGTVLASNFHNTIKNDPKKKNELCYLIDILGHTNLVADDDLKIIETLDIPIIHDSEISISDSDIARLTSCYKNEVADVLNYKNEKHSLK